MSGHYVSIPACLRLVHNDEAFATRQTWSQLSDQLTSQPHSTTDSACSTVRHQCYNQRQGLTNRHVWQSTENFLTQMSTTVPWKDSLNAHWSLSNFQGIRCFLKHKHNSRVKIFSRLDSTYVYVPNVMLFPFVCVRNNPNTIFEEFNHDFTCILCIMWLTQQVCVTSAISVINLINSRDSTIINDVELSVLKVARLERIRFHDHVAGSSLSVVSATGYRSRRPMGGMIFASAGLLLIITTFVQSLPSKVWTSWNNSSQLISTNWFNEDMQEWTISNVISYACGHVVHGGLIESTNS